MVFEDNIWTQEKELIELHNLNSLQDIIRMRNKKGRDKQNM